MTYHNEASEVTLKLTEIVETVKMRCGVEIVSQAVYSPSSRTPGPIPLTSPLLTRSIIQDSREVFFSQPRHGEEVEDPGGGGHLGYRTEDNAVVEIPDIFLLHLSLKLLLPPA